MASYSKKVVYLSYLEQGSKVKGAGFVKVEMIGGKWSFDMRVSGMMELSDGKYDIYVMDLKGKEYKIGGVFLHRGCGEWKESGEGKIAGMDETVCEGLGGFLIKISGEKVIEGRYQASGMETAGKTLKAAEGVFEIKKKGNREVLDSSCEKEIKMEEVILNDKWEQLCRMYPVVHPYEDEREYISIRPKDFVVMTGDYQHLANNSFLLHGFYNYRHIVLGREPRNEDFYLGVPGVYYEREKMVALMFGFEAFECCGGKAEAGKFGYYLRKVKI